MLALGCKDNTYLRQYHFENIKSECQRLYGVDDESHMWFNPGAPTPRATNWYLDFGWALIGYWGSR